MCVYREAELAFSLHADLSPQTNLTLLAKLAAVHHGEAGVRLVGLKLKRHKLRPPESLSRCPPYSARLKFTG